MSRTTKPALRGTLLGTILRLLNPILRWLLASPVHWPWSRWFAVLAWKGRKTGRPYSTPVSYVREGSTAWLTTGDKWWRNLIDGAPVTLWIAGRSYSATTVAVTNEEESRMEHERLFREHRWFRFLAGIPRGAAGGPDASAVAQAVAAGRVLVRVEGLD
jgi:hypothetical protein